MVRRLGIFKDILDFIILYTLKTVKHSKSWTMFCIMILTKTPGDKERKTMD